VLDFRNGVLNVLDGSVHLFLCITLLTEDLSTQSLMVETQYFVLADLPHQNFDDLVSDSLESICKALDVLDSLLHGGGWPCSSSLSISLTSRE